MKLCVIPVLLVLAFVDYARPHIRHYRFRYERVINPKEQERFTQEWFTGQRLDHFTPTDVRTWSQRYFVNLDHFQPKSPIFLDVGGEGAAWGRENIFASQFKAAQIVLEHRYYGASRPTPTATIADLKYLTTEQALEDIATFIDYFSRAHALTPDNKWILFGCSYAGMVVAYFRLKYPHLAVGAIAQSAPIEAKFDFFEFLEVVDYVMGANCSTTMSQATQELTDLIESGPIGWRKIEDMFGLDDASFDGNNRIEVAHFAMRFMNDFMSTAQYVPKGMPGLCRDVFERNVSCSPLKRLANHVAGKHDCRGTDCSYTAHVNQLTRVDSSAFSDLQNWYYQTCTEYGFGYTTDSSRQPFGRLLPIDYFVHECLDIFGPEFTSTFTQQAVNMTNVRYGGRRAIRDSVTNVVFTNSLTDPWNPLGVLVPPPRNPSVRVILDADEGHCQLSPGTVKEVANWIAQLLSQD